MNDIVGTDPVRAAHSAAPPNSETSAAACGADFTSFQSIASLMTAPESSSTTMPCCWAATPTAAARSSRSRPGRGERLPPPVGRAFGAGRVRRAGGPDDGPVLGPAQQHFGGLRGGINPGDQIHDRDASSAGRRDDPRNAAG